MFIERKIFIHTLKFTTMAQFYNHDKRSAADSYSAHKLFASGADQAREKGSVYFEVLDVFKKVFKNINYNSLF